MIPCKPIFPPTAFLGPIGGPELIMIFIVLFLLAVPVLIVVGLLIYTSRNNAAPMIQASPLPPPLPGVESRLAEIDLLKARNLISEAEYAEKRKQILGEI